MEDLLNELNKAVRIRDIDATLTKVLDKLHNDEDVQKDDAVLHATANALYLKLGILLHLNSGAESPIEKMCKALNIVYSNACYGARERSIKAIGGELISLLVLVIEKCKNGQLYDESREITVTAFEVLLNISIAPSAKVPLASKKGMMTIMLDEINREAVCNCTNSDLSKATTLAILSKILSRTDARKILMTQYPDLVNMLLDSLICSAQHSNPEVRYRSAQNIFQLPYFDDANTNMIQRGDLLSVLVELCDDSCGKTRKYAAGTFCQMSFRMSSDSARMLAEHDDGAILSALMTLGGKDKNFDARKYALQTLQNIVCEDSVHPIAGHPGMVVTLAKIGMDDALRDVRAIAIDTLSKITSMMQIKKRLEEEEQAELQAEREAAEQAAAEEAEAEREAAELQAEKEAEEEAAQVRAMQELQAGSISEDQEETRCGGKKWNFMSVFCPTDIFPMSKKKQQEPDDSTRRTSTSFRTRSSMSRSFRSPPRSVTVTSASPSVIADDAKTMHTVESSGSDAGGDSTKEETSSSSRSPIPSVVQSASSSSAVTQPTVHKRPMRKAKACMVCKGRSCEICRGEGTASIISIAQAGQ
eukprot:CAMPEP_0116036340 /NCGR_PEP_ID=MMETSP0321-20121206/21128_1 /TAXON_ID=163516 /ORGANISM="Leptocylindrus danicus var. danicus, Strain B650" /LENGTH=587 /DNA_ID=CAMNT_0003513791 /DNA_START=77 /DNA_END=1840 /DNA_ORIENTATION=-